MKINADTNVVKTRIINPVAGHLYQHKESKALYIFGRHGERCVLLNVESGNTYSGFDSDPFCGDEEEFVDVTDKFQITNT